MTATLIGLVLMSLHVVFGWLVPGLFLESKCKHLRPARMDRSALLVRSLALGSLYLTVQFFLSMAAAQALNAEPYLLTAAKYGMDVAVLGLLLYYDGRECKRWLGHIADTLRDPLIVTLIVLAVGYGLFGIYRCPYAMDNAALGWTNRYVAGEAIPFSHSQGSPAYIALLYFPYCLVRSWIPGPTLAAALKVPLCLLAALAARRITSLLPFRYPRLAGLVYYLVMLLSFFGVYGLFETAKESVFGVVFLMLFFAELLDEDANQSLWAARAGLVLAATFGFGAITIPYAVVLTGTFLLFSLGTTRPFGFVWVLIAMTALPLVPSINAMTHMPLWKATLLVGMLGAICFILRKFPVAQQSNAGRASWVLRAAPVWTVALLLGVYLALPIDYVVSLPPLDGKTDFLDLLFHHGGVAKQVVAAALLGLGISYVLPGFARKPALAAFGLFPFGVLLPTLALARLDHMLLPFHPQHLWDLAKDIPNWCYGFYFGLFALVAIEAVGRLCDSSRWGRRRAKARIGFQHAAVLPVILGLGFLGMKLLGRDYPPFSSPAHFTRIGGHQNALLAETIERFTRQELFGPTSHLNANHTDKVFISKASPVNGRRHEFAMYGIRVEQNLDLSDPEQVQSFIQALPARLVVRRDELPPLAERRYPIVVEEVEQLTEADSIVLVRPDASPQY